jgi:hypothetical protein
MRVKPLIAIPLIAIALAGCSAQQPAPQASTATAEEKPLFTTDEEALAAAQAAYAHYLEVSDQIARDGGANPERLKGLVSNVLLAESTDFAEQIFKQGLHSEGSSLTDTFHIQGRSGNGSEEIISSYVCLRLSQVRIIDESGLDVTPSTRQDSLPMLLSFSINQKTQNLILDSSEVWTGSNFC